jgi:hypothetical protein
MALNLSHKSKLGILAGYSFLGFSAEKPLRVERMLEIGRNAIPPPGTSPSSTAVPVALSASSTRSLFSIIYRVRGAPTSITATPAVSFEKRSLSALRSATFGCIQRRVVSNLGTSEYLG